MLIGWKVVMVLADSRARAYTTTNIIHVQDVHSPQLKGEKKGGGVGRKGEEKKTK